MSREAEIKARLEAATPGPWRADDDALVWSASRKVAAIAWMRSEADEQGRTHPIDFGRDEDAEFIAHSPEDIAYLLQCAGGWEAEWRKAVTQRDRALDLLHEMTSDNDESWEHIRVPMGDGTFYCRGCGFEWPCATVRSRTFLASLHPTPEAPAKPSSSQEGER